MYTFLRIGCDNLNAEIFGWVYLEIKRSKVEQNHQLCLSDVMLSSTISLHRKSAATKNNTVECQCTNGVCTGNTIMERNKITKQHSQCFMASHNALIC